MEARICKHQGSGVICEEIRCKIAKCGWNPKEAKARREMIATRGLTENKDGIRRLVIKRGTGNEKQ